MYRLITNAAEITHLILRRIEAVMLAAAMLFTLSTITDMMAFTGAGLGTDSFTDFDALQSANPDIVAWIRMDGTHIDHPVVQGEDNFEYLTKDANGGYYQGGSIFLDAGNSPDMSENYLIIHGHHMSRGAMFSDIAEYTDNDFFMQNTGGELITPGGIYELKVAGAGIVDAYDGEIYHTGTDAGRPLRLIGKCPLRRDIDFADGDKLVLLSTCSGDMTNDRAVVFCRARYMGEYNARIREK